VLSQFDEIFNEFVALLQNCIWDRWWPKTASENSGFLARLLHRLFRSCDSQESTYFMRFRHKSDLHPILFDDGTYFANVIFSPGQI
jgi:hypothetical protein